MKNSPIRAAIALLLSLGLAACGGGDDPAAPPTDGGSTDSSSVSGVLTISAADPASHNGSVDVGASNVLVNNTALTTVSPAGIDYCDITYAADSTSGDRYEIKVYFRRSDQVVINASVFKTDFSWGIGENDLSNGITAGVTVNLAARTITFSNKVLNGFSSTDVGTVNGTIGFPANATVPACGA